MANKQARMAAANRLRSRTGVDVHTAALFKTFTSYFWGLKKLQLGVAN